MRYSSKLVFSIALAIVGLCAVSNCSFGQDAKVIIPTAGAASDLSFCPKTNELASSHVFDGKVYFWKFRDDDLFFEDSMVALANQRTIFSVAYDTSGKKLATCDLDGTIKVWDLKTRKPIFEYENDKESFFKLRLSGDGERVVVGSWSGTIYVFDCKNPKNVVCLKGHTKMVYLLKFSFDGSYLATGGHDKDIRVWDMKTLKIHRVLEGHKDVVHEINFAAKDSRIVSLSNDKTLRDWDIESKQCTTVELKNYSGNAVALSPDSSRIAVCDRPDKEIRLLDAKGNIIRKYESKIVPNELYFLPSNKHLVIGGNDGDVKLWHIEEKAK